MNRKPLPPGTEMQLYCNAVSGQNSSTQDQIKIDWAKTCEGLSHESVTDPEKTNNGVGTFQQDGLVFDIYVDLEKWSALV